MDKKGFLIGFFQKAKRIFIKKAFEAKRIKYMVQNGNREWIIIIVTICADGLSLLPALIYQAVSDNIQDTQL